MTRAKKSKPLAEPAQDDVNGAQADTLTVNKGGGETRERIMAEFAFSTIIANANTSRAFAAGNLGKIDLNESIHVLSEKAKRITAGDLTDVETTLIAQAATLDAMFNELARRATHNMGQYLDATETYMRLALKAQGQCRATLETLAEIKNPRPLAFVKQQNVAVNQQVNNDAQDENEPRAHGKTTIQPNELSGITHELSTDSRAPAPTSGVDSQVETVGALDRAQD